MNRSTLVRWIIALSTGGYMAFDGSDVLTTGRYFGPGFGPWSAVVSAVGVDPYSMGPIFLTLGILWVLFMIATSKRSRLGWYGSLLTSVGTLWYLLVGTILSLAYVLLLLPNKPRLTGPRG